jgi:hypothetical protein
MPIPGDDFVSTSIDTVQFSEVERMAEKLEGSHVLIVEDIAYNQLVISEIISSIK